MRKYIIHKGFIGLLILFMAGCTKEDCTQGNSSLLLNIRYIVDSEGENLFQNSVGTVSVFIFDSEGIYISTKTELVSELEADNYMMAFPISSNGTYKVIILGDAHSDHYIIGTETSTKATKTLTSGISHISDFRVMVKHEDNVVNRALGELFISKPNDVLVDGIGGRVVKVDLIKNTKTIHLTVDGLEHISTFTPIIRNANGVYNAENTIPDNAEVIKYMPHTATTKSFGNYQTSMLRIIKSHQIPLTLEDDNGNIIEHTKSYDLMSLIQLNTKYQTQQDLDNEDEFNIVLNYKKDVLISVTINSHKHILVTPEV